MNTPKTDIHRVHAMRMLIMTFPRDWKLTSDVGVVICILADLYELKRTKLEFICSPSKKVILTHEVKDFTRIL